MILTNAETKAIGSAIYNFEFMVKAMRDTEGITEEQIAHETAKLKLAKRGFKKVRDARKEQRRPVAVSDPTAKD